MKKPSHHGHTTECRDRLQEAARTCPEMAERIDDAERRVDTALGQSSTKRSRAEPNPSGVNPDGDVDMPPADDTPPPKTLRLGALVMDPNVDADLDDLCYTAGAPVEKGPGACANGDPYYWPKHADEPGVTARLAAAKRDDGCDGVDPSHVRERIQK